ncbi:MAG: Zn-ribbon domain-containing OB-fold protein, partial [Candidatus Methylomirabilales bacterium]
PNVGELLSYTVLYTPPEGFSAPLPLALVELAEGARFLCHGHEAEIGDLKVGQRVLLEVVDDIYFFSTLSFGERVRLFWRRRSELPAKLRAIGKSLVRFSSRR